jgi:hypothetical protein
VLFEEDELGVGIPGFLEKIFEDVSVLEVHPVLTVLVDLAVVSLEVTVFTAQLSHLVNVLSGEIVSVIGRVLAAHLDRKWTIAHVIELCIVGMASHHGGGSPPVCQDGRHVVHPVSSC